MFTRFSTQVDLVRSLPRIVAPILADKALLVIPQRTAVSLDSYPPEQHHSEMFGNLQIHNIAVSAGLIDEHTPQMDWMFGPIAFERTQAQFFLTYAGTLWDAQIVPLLLAMTHAKKAGMPSILTSVDVDFIYPPQQRMTEKGSVEYGDKRLMQLSYLMPIIKRTLIEPKPLVTTAPDKTDQELTAAPSTTEHA